MTPSHLPTPELLAEARRLADAATVPQPGDVHFGGGVAERYLGDGRWQRYREDERECPRVRYGMAHPAHEHSYVYTRPADQGGITTGNTWCDGLPFDAEPYPLCPLLPELADRLAALTAAVERVEALCVGAGIHGSLIAREAIRAALEGRAS